MDSRVAALAMTLIRKKTVATGVELCVAPFEPSNPALKHLAVGEKVQIWYRGSGYSTATITAHLGGYKYAVIWSDEGYEENIDLELENRTYSESNDSRWNVLYTSPSISPSISRLPLSKTPLIDAVVYCALRNWGITRETLFGGLRLYVTDYHIFIDALKLFCAIELPFNQERYRILSKWFRNYPTNPPTAFSLRPFDFTTKPLRLVINKMSNFLEATLLQEPQESYFNLALPFDTSISCKRDRSYGSSDEPVLKKLKL